MDLETFFDSVVIKFIVNNRTDSKTDVNLFFVFVQFLAHLLFETLGQNS